VQKFWGMPATPSQLLGFTEAGSSHDRIPPIRPTDLQYCHTTPSSKKAFLPILFVETGSSLELSLDSSYHLSHRALNDLNLISAVMLSLTAVAAVAATFLVWRWFFSSSARRVPKALKELPGPKGETLLPTCNCPLIHVLMPSWDRLSVLWGPL
jgi:hypothetical protein